jgi:UDP-2,3-diacylglucosamine pyrophosphatase LpxH
MQHSKWLTRLGSESYDFLIWLNYHVNRLLVFCGKEKKSFSKQIKNGVKSAVKYINQFEEICAEIAIKKKYDYVICGHIHQPEIRKIERDGESVLYLNSGDWIENLSALEYNKKEWLVYTYSEKDFEPQLDEEIKDTQAIFDEMLEEFQLFTFK